MIRIKTPRAAVMTVCVGLAVGCAHPVMSQVMPQITSQAPTVPAAPDTFAVLPIMENISAIGTGKFTESDLQTEMTKLKLQIGENHGKFRIGFSHILGSAHSLDVHCRLALANHEAVGVIIAVQTHSGGVPDLTKQDFRRTQWRLDGKTWEGEPVLGKNGNPLFPDRDWHVPTPSRYCTANREAALAIVRSKAKIIRAAMDAYPGVIVAVNASIEEELATGGQTSDGYLADYSPYAVTEFRDWLRHTGQYDDTAGAYADQGAPAEIVGPFVRINGALRSPFYDAASPNAVGSGGGRSFNAWFGTKFTTWTLRSWDLDTFPGPIIDKNFSPMPTSGAGFTDGGFDAPRVRDRDNAYWRAWSWDVFDQGGAYPPGNPMHPAFGFRQVEVKHFVSDVLDEVRKAGVPADILYAHQIPGEQVSAARLRSGADPIWTGYYEPSGTLGITRFGPIDVSRMTQYSRNWGIFEWHPKPYTKSDDPKLYESASKDLENYYQNGGRVFFAGWWHPGGPAPAGDIFPLNDSLFAKAIRDWLASKP